MAELTYEAVKNMTASEFKKEFKAQKALFKKATYMVAVVDYKLSDKKQTILLPYKKKSEAKADFKLLKKDKNAKMANTVAGELKAGKSPEEVVFEIQKGGGTPESVGGELAGYFEALATKLQVKQGKMEEEEADEAETAEKPATKISEAFKEAKPADKTNSTKPEKPQTKEEKIAKYTAIFESLKKSYIEIQNLKSAFKKAPDKKTKEPIAVELLKKAAAWVKSYEAQKNDIPTNDKLEEVYAGLLEFLGKKPAVIPDLAPTNPENEPKSDSKADDGNKLERIVKAIEEAFAAMNKIIAKEKEGDVKLLGKGTAKKLEEAYLAANGKRTLKAILSERGAYYAWGKSSPADMEMMAKKAGLDAILAKYGLE